MDYISIYSEVLDKKFNKRDEYFNDTGIREYVHGIE